MFRCSQRQVRKSRIFSPEIVLPCVKYSSSSRKENEMETDDAHERRLTQVLLALALFLNYFEASKRVELTNHFKTIFDSGKFWKLDKIKSTQVNSCPFNRSNHSHISSRFKVHSIVVSTN